MPEKSRKVYCIISRVVEYLKKLQGGLDKSLIIHKYLTTLLWPIQEFLAINVQVILKSNCGYEVL